MSKEADSSIAICTILAEPCPILSWMEPALKNSMSILTHITTPASSLSEIRTRDTAVVEFSWVPSSSIFTRMNKRALGPIMGVGTRTRSNLE